jgi:hypothetical protein
LADTSPMPMSNRYVLRQGPRALGCHTSWRGR